MTDTSTYVRELMRFTKALQARRGELAYALSPALMRDLRAGRAMVTDRTHAIVVAELDRLLASRQTELAADAPGLAEFHSVLGAFDWIERHPATGRYRVSSAVLLSYGADRADGTLYAEDGELHLVLEFRTPLRKFEPVELCRELRPSQLGAILRQFILKTLKSGCTELVVLLREEAAFQAIGLFLNGQLQSLDVGVAYLELPIDRGWRDGPPLKVDLDSPDAGRRLQGRWRQALLRQPAIAAADEVKLGFALFVALAVPGRRGAGRVVRTLAESAHGFLASPSLRPARLRRWLVLGAVEWQALTALACVAAIGALHLLGFPAAMLLGIVSGLALALAGSVNCALSTSPLAGFAGAIGIGGTFAVAHALIAAAAGGTASLARLLAHADPFVVTAGGLVGAGAGLLGGLPRWLVVSILGSTGAAIGWSGWLMTRPDGAGPRVRLGRPRFWLGILAGISAGGGIGGVKAMTLLGGRLAGSPEAGLVLGFAFLGAAATWISVWLATGSRRTARRFSALHAVASTLLLSAAHAAAPSTAGVILSAAATGYFHATFFMAALLIAWAVGGARSGVAAAAVEGVGGYIGFVLFRMAT